MASRHVFSALGGLFLSASVAFAAVETRMVTITNNTANHWAKVLFYINGPLLSDADPFFMIQFAEDMSLHTASANPVSMFIVDPGINDVLAFDYSPFATLAPGGSYEFTMTIINPLDAPFELAWRTLAGPPQVPAPAAALVLAAGLLGTRRRRA